jgi:hypothetical protein
VDRSAYLGKATQLCRALRPAESIPGIAPYADIAGQAAAQVTESHCPDEPSDIADHLNCASQSVRCRVEPENQKHGRLRQRRDNALGLNGHAVDGICHRIDLSGVELDTQLCIESILGGAAPLKINSANS